MPDTAKRMARVPILGEDGRISDDYVPAAIGEGVESAEAAATAAESAKKAAETARDAAVTAKDGAESAKTAAESAKVGAESAKAAAESAKTSAEGSASQAATGAKQAAYSAQQAADKAASVLDHYIASAQATTLDPGSEATASVADQVLTLGIPRGDKGDKGDTGEKGDPGDVSAVQTAEGSDLSVSTDGGTVTIDDSALRERIEDLENACGNVLKGTLGPAPLLSADDAYATKPRKLTVNGATRQNLWVNPSRTNNGITATSNADGSLTVSGTSTDSAYITAPVSYILRPGTQYTLSVSPAPVSGLRFQVIEQNADSVRTYHSLGPTHLSGTFTVKSDTVLCVMRTEVASAGTTVSGTYRVMLNEGSEAEPWCPPGLNGVDELSIVTAGKNLFETNFDDGNFYGVAIKTNSDGSISLDGTLNATDQCYPVIAYDFPLLPGTYTMSCYDDTSDSLAFRCELYDIGNKRIDIRVGRSVVVTEGMDIKRFCLVASLNPGQTYDGTYHPQLEIGSEATDWVSPALLTTPINLDGHALNSLPDGTRDELRIDGGGNVVLEKRVGVATAPTEASRWALNTDSAGERAFFMLSSEGPTPRPNKTAFLLCDKLPVRKTYDDTSYALVSDWRAYAKNPAITSTATAATVAGGATYLYPLATPQTIPLPSVTLPTLPAPTVNVWADAEASGAGYAMDPDVELEYERDVTIAFSKLQAQISATTVREATNG